jgi:hypothetical protein
MIQNYSFWLGGCEQDSRVLEPYDKVIAVINGKFIIDDDVIKLAHLMRIKPDSNKWDLLFFDHGPYDITTTTSFCDSFIRGIIEMGKP